MKIVNKLLLVSAFAAILCSSVDAALPNPKLAALPENSWMILDSAGFQVEGRMAYSGGTYDRKNHQFLLFGGGHYDGYKNDIVAFDIEKGTWRSMYTSDPGSAYTCANVDSLRPGMLVSSGLPASRHTYDQIKFMDNTGKMAMWGNNPYATLWSCPGYNMRDTWLYDYETNTWEYKNTTRSPQPLAHGASAYDPATGLLWALTESGEMWTYNAVSNIWTLTTLTGSYKPGGYDRAMVTDRKKSLFYLYDTKIACFNPATRSWAALATTPANTDDNPSYDDLWDDVLFFKDNQSLLSVYHTADSTWDVITPRGTIPEGSDRAYGRFFYDPIDSVHLFITQANYRSRVYAYRYRRGAPVADATPPSAPAELQVTALSDTTVRLSWSAAVDPENRIIRYRVFRNGTEIMRTETLSIVDSGLHELTAYDYTVVAVNAMQLKSSPSSVAHITTPANTVPPSLVTPSPLTARCSTLVLTFTEPLDSASAVNPTHYSLDNNGIVRGAALSADGKTVTLTSAPLSFTASYTITLNGITDRAKTPNVIAAGTKLLFTVPNAQLVVDYGASAAANRFGMAGWTRVIMDAYVGYMSNGPAGIYTEGSGGYDFRGVIGTPRLFKAGETISATWYNMQSYPITFTPKVSLRDSSRPANTNNGWRTMSTITIPPDRSLESIYTIDTASAGTYQVVNVSSNYTPPGYPDRLMLCDRIEYFTIDSGTTSIDHISGDGETGSELTVSPNPFNPSVNIRLSGVSVRPLQFRIYNLSGHCIAQLTSATNQGAVVWNADSEPSGIYLVVARSAGKTFSRKIILSK